MLYIFVFDGVIFQNTADLTETIPQLTREGYLSDLYS